MFYHPTYPFMHLTRWDLQKGPIRHMDRLPIAHTGPILALDWSSAASSIQSRARDDGVGHSDDGVGGGMGMAGAGVGGVGGGVGLSSGGWIVSAGLDRTVKVTCHHSISSTCILIFVFANPDMGRIPLPHPTQTHLYTPPFLPRTSRPLATGIRMRTRDRLE